MILVACSNADPFNQDLLPHLGDLALPANLPYGDANIAGVWENNRPVRVLVERKRILDIVQCVLSTGRHMEQVRDAREAGFDFIFLIVEGLYRCSPQTGLIELRQGKEWVPMSRLRTRKGSIPDLEYKRLDDYLNQLDLYLSVKFRETSDARMTAKRILDLHYLYQKPPEDHTSLRQFYTPPDAYADFLDRPSLVRRVAAQFEGVGWMRARAFDQVFPNLASLSQTILDRNEKSLRRVDGVGKVLAQRILTDSWLETGNGG